GNIILYLHINRVFQRTDLPTFSILGDALDYSHAILPFVDHGGDCHAANTLCRGMNSSGT
ncbi:hypothetical protein, partial [Eisenbergiella sp.]|uniref:hypothetical protein n=1 Tax=Eisenbergiella sp. TaxID=1924109 RepID=UPI002A811F5C